MLNSVKDEIFLELFAGIYNKGAEVNGFFSEDPIQVARSLSSS